MADDLNVIKRCKQKNLPPSEGDQYYLVEMKDGGPPAFAATKASNAYDIISNALRIHGMDWGDILHRARTSGSPYPTIESMSASPYGGPENKFEFECGTFLVIAEGPLDFDEVMAQKKNPQPPVHNPQQELQEWHQPIQSSTSSTSSE